MPRFQGYYPPFQYYRPYNYKPHDQHQSATVPHNRIPEKPAEPDQFSYKKNKTDPPIWLDLFGIKLYFDDVLILSLLFFLYKF